MAHSKNTTWNGILNAAVLLTAALCTSPSFAFDNARGESLACDTGAGSDPPADLCIEATDADTPWRYIAITTGAGCPSAQNWTRTKLFRPEDGGEIPPGLANFCVYEAEMDPPKPGELHALRCEASDPPPNCLARLDPDAAAMSLQGTEMAEVLWEPMREHFLNQVGHAGALPSSPQNVRLAVIDTEPTGLVQDTNGSGTSQHGFTLLNLVRDMICPVASPCAVEIQSRLALALVRCPDVTGFCRDETNGGYAGTIGELAVAIREEVAEWSAGGIENLVINLSVAWDARFVGETPISNSRVAAQAVYRALQDASCRGVLVIAAAGNRVTGPDASEGPLFPAAWETETSPGMSECSTLLDVAPDPDDFAGDYRPLVYAVGAVHTDNTPAETRQQGEPRLVAFGDHAVSRIDDIGIPGPTQVLTGSSVSAAVVSAAAAAAWHFREDVSPDELMQAVYDGGFDVGRTADFCSGGAGCSFDVRRVTACRAVEKVCGEFPGPQCPAASCVVPSTILVGLPEDDIDALFSSATVIDVSTLIKTTPVDNCRPGLIVYSLPGSVLTDPCPQIQYYSVQATPWTDGQPEGGYCPSCIGQFHSPGTLFVEIDSAMEGVLTELTLVCKDDTFRIPGKLVAGDKLRVTEIPEHCEFEELALAARLDNGTGSPASFATAALLLPDRDDDGVQDGFDNCVDVPNPDQVDADNDGIGNACDGDFNDDCGTNFLDLAIMKAAFFGTDPEIDLNSDGTVNFLDVARFKNMLFLPPGPSGIDNVCDP